LGAFTQNPTWARSFKEIVAVNIRYPPNSSPLIGSEQSHDQKQPIVMQKFWGSVNFCQKFL